MSQDLVNIQFMDSICSLVGTHTLERPPQVSAAQRRLQQGRVQVYSSMSRAKRLVAGDISHGVTLPYGLPPRCAWETYRGTGSHITADEADASLALRTEATNTSFRNATSNLH